jgi:hypothetical protein
MGHDWGSHGRPGIFILWQEIKKKVWATSGFVVALLIYSDMAQNKLIKLGQDWQTLGYTSMVLIFYQSDGPLMGIRWLHMYGVHISLVHWPMFGILLGVISVFKNSWPSYGPVWHLSSACELIDSLMCTWCKLKEDRRGSTA